MRVFLKSFMQYTTSSPPFLTFSFSPACSISFLLLFLFPYFFFFSAYMSPFLIRPPLLLLLPLSMSPYAVSGSFTWLEERKGEDPASLNYTCSPDAQIQVGPTACLPCGFSAFVSAASLYMESSLLSVWVFVFILISWFSIIHSMYVQKGHLSSCFFFFCTWINNAAQD